MCLWFVNVTILIYLKHLFLRTFALHFVNDCGNGKADLEENKVRPEAKRRRLLDFRVQCFLLGNDGLLRATSVFLLHADRLVHVLYVATQRVDHLTHITASACLLHHRLHLLHLLFHIVQMSFQHIGTIVFLTDLKIKQKKKKNSTANTTYRKLLYNHNNNKKFGLLDQFC